MLHVLNELYAVYPVTKQSCWEIWESANPIFAQYVIWVGHFLVQIHLFFLKFTKLYLFFEILIWYDDLHV